MGKYSKPVEVFPLAKEGTSGWKHQQPNISEFTVFPKFCHFTFAG